MLPEALQNNRGSFLLYILSTKDSHSRFSYSDGKGGIAFALNRDIEDDKVIDHCHYSGTFLCFAHPESNINKKTTNLIPVIVHNSSNYDLHHVCMYIHKFKPGCKIDVIPSTDEKYLTLSVGVPVRTYQDKNGVTKTVLEYLRFIDSSRFMGASLEKLVSDLPEDKFEILGKVFLIILKKSETSYIKRGIIHTPTLTTLKSLLKRSYHREKNGKTRCAMEKL